MKKLFIDKIYKEKTKFGYALKTNVYREDEKYEMFFDYSISDEGYLDDYFADSFLVALLPYAMQFGYNIECFNPISSDVYYNIANDYIKSLSKWKKCFNSIEIINPKIEIKKIEGNNAVATGVSCGVDSLYTILSNYKNEKVTEDYKLTHLYLVNTGACNHVGGEISYNWFMQEADQAKKVADELGLGLILVNSNLMEFYKIDHRNSGYSRIIGTILGINKLIGKYYFASGFELVDFTFKKDTDGTYAYYVVNNYTSNNLKLFLTGNSYSRDDRVEFIADSKIAQEHLNVCWNNECNCGKCEKCLRTQGSLYSIGKLDLFNKVFNVENFNRHKIKNIAWMLNYRKKHIQEYTFLKKIKKIHIFLYLFAKIYYICIIQPYNLTKKFAKLILPKKIIKKLKGSI